MENPAKRSHTNLRDNKDTIAKELRQGKSASQIARDHLWNLSGVTKIARRIKEGKGPARKQGSGSQRSQRTTARIDKLKKVIQSNPKISLRDAGAKVGLGKNATRNAFRKDNGFKALKLTKQGEMTESQVLKRLQFCQQSLKAIEEGRLDPRQVVWTDEKLFSCGGGAEGGSTQNNLYGANRYLSLEGDTWESK